MGQLLVMLPCLNEAQNLPGLLASFESLLSAIPQQHRLSVLVVDDGSTDDTARIAQEWGGDLTVELVRHERNRGLGAGLLTGIRWFMEHYGDQSDSALAAMDADGTHPPNLLLRMLEADSEIVIASRYAPGGEEHGLTARRKFYSRAASTALGILCRVKGARDYSCGYRLYRQSALVRGIQRFGDSLVEETGFVCMAELLIKLARCGASVSEVPLKLHYELKGGASKMNVPATIRRYIAVAWKATFNPGWRREQP